MRLGFLLSSLLLGLGLLAGPPAIASEHRATITGRVVDADGRPVPHAVVVVVGGSQYRQEAVVKAGADGRFSDRVIVPGRPYHLAVCERPDDRPWDCSTHPEWLPVYVGPGQQTDTPLKLTGLFQPSRKRIDLGRVVLRDQPGSLRIRYNPAARNSFRISGVHEGSRKVNLYAVQPGVIGADDLRPGRYWIGHTRIGALGPTRIPVTIRSGETTWLERDGEPATVSGTVTVDSAPVGGAVVKLQREDHFKLAYTAADGSYEFVGVPEGELDIRVSDVAQPLGFTEVPVTIADRSSQVEADVSVDSTERGSVRVTVPPADAVQAQYLHVSRLPEGDLVGGVEVENGVADLHGLPPGEYGLSAVWDWDSYPVNYQGWTTVDVTAGATTEATVAPRPLAGDLTVHLPELTFGADVFAVRPAWTTSADQRFHVRDEEVQSGLPVGDYRLVPVANRDSGYLPGMPRLITMGEEDQEVTLDRGPRSATLRLTFTDAGGRPIPPDGLFGVRCERPESDDPWPTTTDSWLVDGTATVLRGLAPGAWSCTADSSLYPRERADAYGYAPVGPFTLRSGEVTKAKVRLRAVR